MENIHLNLYNRTVDLSNEKLLSETKITARYKYSIDYINKQFIDDLFGIILKTKGDWVDFQYNYFNKNYYVDIYLVYQNEFTARDKVTNNRVIKACEEYLEIKSASNIKMDYNNAEILSKILDDEGFIINIVEEDGSAILNYNAVNEIFKKNKIEYEILNINEYNRECGASMGAEDILYFIAASSASGITWDVIKSIYNVNIKPISDAIKLYIFDNFSFKKMRKTIAERIREEEKNIVLYKMIKDGEKNLILFRTENKSIKIVTDNHYNIINFKMKNE